MTDGPAGHAPPPNAGAWRAVAHKELVDSARDRRALASLLLFPLLGPALVSAMLTQAVERATGEQNIRLPVAGAERAPGLTAYLREQGIAVTDAPADAERAVKDGAASAVLILPSDYGSSLRRTRPEHVLLVIDRARDDAAAAAGRVKAALRGYSATVGAMRQLARGQSPDFGQALAVDEVDVSTPRARSFVFLNFVPMFALLAAFMGGMHAATDSTAGERERGSLEPLLLTPATAFSLALGKWLAAVAFSSLAVVATLGCTLAALTRVPLAQLGMTARVEPAQIAWMLAAALPVSWFNAGLQLMVATFARTVKEAQVSMSLLVLVPMLPALFLSLSPLKTKLWLSLVPVLGQEALISSVLRGEAARPLLYLLSAASCALFGAFGVLATAALLRRERIVFGR